MLFFLEKSAIRMIHRDNLISYWYFFGPSDFSEWNHAFLSFMICSSKIRVVKPNRIIISDMKGVFKVIVSNSIKPNRICYRGRNYQSSARGLVLALRGEMKYYWHIVDDCLEDKPDKINLGLPEVN